MKVVAKKKTIVILIVCFIVSFLAGVSVLIKTKESTTPQVQKLPEESYSLIDYEELQKSCDLERIEENIVLNCKGILEEVTTNDKQKCLKLRILTDNNTNLKKTIICVKEESLHWEDPYRKEGFLLPINMVLIYIDTDTGVSLQDIEITLLEDSVLFELSKKNNKINALSHRILTKKIYHLLKNNYNLRDFYLTDDISVAEIIFPNLILKSITENNGELELLFNGQIMNKAYDLTFYSNGFFYEDTKTKTVVFIGSKNYKKLKLDIEYSFLAQFTNSHLPPSVKELCQSVGSTTISEGSVKREDYANRIFHFCATLPTKLEDLYIQNIENYFESAIKDTNNTQNNEKVNLERLRPSTLIFFPK